MSIVIRLQNLPLNAKTADIRNFFGGLRIPSGGVHILGGDKGDAFIAFNSDEDARVAMRKDGGKLKDSRVKLYLSSHMEMQYEVEKITKNNPQESFQKMRNPERRPHEFNRSPDTYHFNHGMYENTVRHLDRSRSPTGLRPRSRSPRMRSRSSRRSPSPNSESYFQRSISPKIPGYVRSTHEMDARGIEAGLGSHDWKNSEFNNSPKLGLSTSELQAQLERRITEAMEQNSALLSGGAMEHQGSVPNMDVPYGNMMVSPSQLHPFPDQNMPSMMVHNNLNFPPPLPPFLNNEQCLPQGLPPPIPAPHPLMWKDNVNEMERQIMTDSFYVSVSGLDPIWSFREIQVILKGMYVPESNIRWEVDNTGFKTGTAFIKLTNRDDFENIIRMATFFFSDRRLTVSECPKFLILHYFHEDTGYPYEYGGTKKYDLCYALKGLPFACTYDDIISFYQGFEVADIVIFYGKDGKASGTGYVSFANQRDFEAAFARNGNKIGHRYIEMKPSTDHEMAKGKQLHPSAHSFTSYSKLIAERSMSTQRPLCAIITGLPHYTSAKKLTTFFTESGIKADAIHITVNKKKGCDGRAFIEFTNFRDFDLALKLHGSMFQQDIIICVKQILYDEMVRILDTQKARHKIWNHFETPVPVEPAFVNLPEKVPYLWEPPDAPEEHIVTKDNTRPVTQNAFPWENFSNNNRTQQNFKQNVNRTNFQKQRVLTYIPHHLNSIDNISKPSIKEQNFDNRESKIDQRTQNNSFNKKKALTSKDTVREPIKFNVNKPLSINSKKNETFEPVESTEDKIKLSKLSPEKETSQGSRLKNLQTKNVNLEKKMPAKKENFSQKERKDSREDKNFKSKSDSFSRNRNEKEFGRSYEKKIDSRPPRYISPPRHIPCVVQVTNVCPSVGTQDLMDFLYGFAFDARSIIRRYTDIGEPTGDVRVAFINRKEAELAIRSLNGRHLKDIRVNMFIT